MTTNLRSFVDCSETAETSATRHHIFALIKCGFFTGLRFLKVTFIYLIVVSRRPTCRFSTSLLIVFSLISVIVAHKKLKVVKNTSVKHLTELPVPISTNANEIVRFLSFLSVVDSLCHTKYIYQIPNQLLL